MQQRERCGQSRDGLVCDRWRDHDGDHRGYNEQIDEPMFWSTTCRAVHSSGARCELREGHTVNHKGAFAHGVVQWSDNLDGPAGGARVCNQAEPRTTQSTGILDTAPIPLSRQMLEAIRTWAADDRLWSTKETTEFNLCTFARLILKAQAESGS